MSSLTYREMILTVLKSAKSGKRMSASEIKAAMTLRYRLDEEKMAKLTGMISSTLDSMVDKGEAFVDKRTTGPRGGKMFYAKKGSAAPASKKKEDKPAKKSPAKSAKVKVVAETQPANNKFLKEILAEVREVKQLILDALYEKPAEESTEEVATEAITEETTSVVDENINNIDDGNTSASLEEGFNESPYTEEELIK